MIKLELNIYDDTILDDVIVKLQKYSKYLDVGMVKKKYKKEKRDDIVTFFKNSGLKQSDLTFDKDEVYKNRVTF